VRLHLLRADVSARGDSTLGGCGNHGGLPAVRYRCRCRLGCRISANAGAATSRAPTAFRGKGATRLEAGVAGRPFIAMVNGRFIFAPAGWKDARGPDASWRLQRSVLPGSISNSARCDRRTCRPRQMRRRRGLVCLLPLVAHAWWGERRGLISQEGHGAPGSVFSSPTDRSRPRLCSPVKRYGSELKNHRRPNHFGHGLRVDLRPGIPG
jgi:hypothetical protein